MAEHPRIRCASPWRSQSPASDAYDKYRTARRLSTMAPSGTGVPNQPCGTTPAGVSARLKVPHVPKNGRAESRPDSRLFVGGPVNVTQMPANGAWQCRKISDLTPVLWGCSRLRSVGPTESLVERPMDGQILRSCPGQYVRVTASFRRGQAGIGDEMRSASA
jgi:hypothetical protein